MVSPTSVGTTFTVEQLRRIKELRLELDQHDIRVETWLLTVNSIMMSQPKMTEQDRIDGFIQYMMFGKGPRAQLIKIILLAPHHHIFIDPSDGLVSITTDNEAHTAYIPHYCLTQITRDFALMCVKDIMTWYENH